MHRLVIAVLVVPLGWAQSDRMDERSNRAAEAATYDAATAAADANCATGMGPCQEVDYGEQVAEAPNEALDHLIEAGRRCGVRGGATVHAHEGGRSKLFWKGIDEEWRACFQAARRSLAPRTR